MATPIRIDETLLSRLCPARPETGHKGTFGRLLIYAGSTGMGGAAVMAAGSALRSGAGLVYVLTSQDVLTPLLIRCPEALGIPLPQEKTSSPLVPMAGGLSRLMPAVPAEKESWFSKIISDKQDEIDRLTEVDILTGEIKNELTHAGIFPASHYVVPEEQIICRTMPH